MPARRQSTQPGSTLVDVTALRDEILAAVNANLMRAVGEALSKLSITVPQPSVHVAAPTVQITPKIDLPAFPKIPEPVVVVQMEGINSLVTAVNTMSDKLDECMQHMMKSRVREVERDTEGRIKRVIDKGM
jgi:hypothetical protein